MLTIVERPPLAPLHTFGCIGHAEALVRAERPEDIRDYLANQGLPEKFLILGGGSNLLFLGDYPGVLLVPAMTGVSVIEDDETGILLKVGAGVSWHKLVCFTLNERWYGLENLALIPGTVGAAPVQNIGAYGVELADRLAGVEILDIASGELRSLSPEQCQLTYRDSIFKKELAGKVIITAVELRLSRRPQVRADYSALASELARRGIVEPTPEQVFEAVCHVRRSKLPDPATLGNAGSFFKNPQVSAELAAKLKVSFPGLPVYPQADGGVKLAAGWLIEQCGFKGMRRGAVGVHEHQSLVLVNYGGASGEAVLELSQEIQHTVHEHFGVELTPEVRVVS